MAVKTFTTGEVLTAADTNTYLANAGLVYLSTDTFTALTTAQTKDVSGVFTSTYDYYRLIIDWVQNTAAGNITIKLRDSGGAISTNYAFGFGGSYAPGGAPTWAGFSQPNNTTQTSIFAGATNTSDRGTVVMDIMNPNLAQVTLFTIQMTMQSYSATGTLAFIQGGAFHNAATQCTGFSICPTVGGSVTGKYALYGYRKA